jgi:hypothetical protein
MGYPTEAEEEQYRQRVLARNRKERRICRRLAPAIGLIAAVYGLASEQSMRDSVSTAAINFVIGWAGTWGLLLLVHLLRSTSLTGGD